MAAEYQYVPIVYKKKKTASARYAGNRDNIHKQIAVYNAEKKKKAKRAAAVQKSQKAKKIVSIKSAGKAVHAAAATVSLPYPYYTERTAAVSKSIARPVERPVEKEKVKIRVNKGIISTILLVVFVLAMLVMVLAGNSVVSGVNLENAKISKEITSINEEIKDIQLDISFAENLENIQNRAKILGLGTPRANQIVYIGSGDMGLSKSTDEAVASDDSSFVVKDELG